MILENFRRSSVLHFQEIFMEKELPSDLRKKLKRMTESRDNLKEKNREKVLLNQSLRDRNVEIQDSRDQWQNKYKNKNQENKELERQLQSAQEEILREKECAEQALKREGDLAAQLKELRGKKSRS